MRCLAVVSSDNKKLIMQEPSDASDGLGLTAPTESAFVRKASSSASTVSNLFGLFCLQSHTSHRC